MPRTAVESTASGGTLYRYATARNVAQHGDPLLLVPPLGAPDFAFDQRRGCSLVEHLLSQGRPVYLVDYGAMDFAHRSLGLEAWVDDLLPQMVAAVGRDAGAPPVHLLGWSLGGVFSVLTAAAHDLPVASVTAVTSPFDISAVPLVAPLGPLAQLTGGQILTQVYRAVGTLPAPVVKWAFQLSSVDKMVTKPLAIASNLDNRDCLEQIEAVGHLMSNMHAYPGRAFGQIFHLSCAPTTWLPGSSTWPAGRSSCPTSPPLCSSSPVPATHSRRRDLCARSWRCSPDQPRCVTNSSRAVTSVRSPADRPATRPGSTSLSSSPTTTPPCESQCHVAPKPERVASRARLPRGGPPRRHRRSRTWQAPSHGFR